MVLMVERLIVDQEEKVRIFLLGPKKSLKSFILGVYKRIYIYYITTITKTILWCVRGRVKAKQTPGVSAMPAGLILNDGTRA